MDDLETNHLNNGKHATNMYTSDIFVMDVMPNQD